MRRASIALFVAALALAIGCPRADATARRGESRVARAAFEAHLRLDARIQSKGLAFGDELFIRVFKEERELEVWLRHGEARFELFKTYRICAASGELGPKVRQGDSQAPEGFYSVARGALNPRSNYHLSFNVGYPNAYDRALGRTGSLIMVHGDCVSIGCFAMTDAGIEEIYTLADAALTSGQRSFPVHIFPFRMTDANMKRHASSRWRPFWQNIKKGHDAFERTRVPPEVSVKGRRYTFSE